MDKNTGKQLDEKAHIKQSIADILQTPKGSRVMRREYGSQLFELIDRPMNSVLIMQIAAASVMALKQWENRIEVIRFRPQFDPNHPSGLTAEIEAITTQNQTKLNITSLNLR